MTQQKTKTHHNGAVSGRQRLVWPTLESIKQASGLCGFSEAEIKAAKAAGSKAFIRGGRIDSLMLIQDINNLRRKPRRLPDGIVNAQEWLIFEKAQREAIKRQQDEGSMMPTADAIRWNAEAMAMVFAELERRSRELPPALAGLPAVDIFKRMEADTESIRRSLKSKFEEKSQ